MAMLMVRLLQSSYPMAFQQASPESWMHEASDWTTYYSKFGPPTHASMLKDAR